MTYQADDLACINTGLTLLWIAFQFVREQNGDDYALRRSFVVLNLVVQAAQNSAYTLRSVAPNEQARISGVLPKCKAGENLEGLGASVGALENIDLPESTPADPSEICRYVRLGGVDKNVDEIEMRAESVRQFGR